MIGDALNKTIKLLKFYAIYQSLPDLIALFTCDSFWKIMLEIGMTTLIKTLKRSTNLIKFNEVLQTFPIKIPTLKF